MDELAVIFTDEYWADVERKKDLVAKQLQNAQAIADSLGINRIFCPMHRSYNCDC